VWKEDTPSPRTRIRVIPVWMTSTPPSSSPTTTEAETWDVCPLGYDLEYKKKETTSQLVL